MKSPVTQLFLTSVKNVLAVMMTKVVPFLPWKVLLTATVVVVRAMILLWIFVFDSTPIFHALLITQATHATCFLPISKALNLAINFCPKSRWLPSWMVFSWQPEVQKATTYSNKKQTKHNQNAYIGSNLLVNIANSTRSLPLEKRQTEVFKKETIIEQQPSKKLTNAVDALFLSQFSWQVRT